MIRVLVYVVFAVIPGWSQTIETDTLLRDPIIAPKASDSLEVLRQNSKKDSIVGIFDIFSGEPGRAALYSLVAPGGGQIYNKKYFKGALAIIADATALGVGIYWTREYNNFDALYREHVRKVSLGIPSEVYGTNDITALINERNRLRRYRDQSWVALGAVHFVTIIEAFVDRHLMTFDINEDLTLTLIPAHTFSFAGLTYTF